MDGYSKDSIPMLSDTNQHSFEENEDRRLHHFNSRTRSASISIPMESVESFEIETNLVGYTGPLRSERRAPLVQRSGPLYMNRKTQGVFQKQKGETGRKIVEPQTERFPSFSGMDTNAWIDGYGAKNEHLLRSGQLGMCSDPYCTTCPTYNNFKASKEKHSRASIIFDSKFHNSFYGDAKGWATRFVSFINPYIPGVMNPHAKVVQRWTIFFVISCIVAIFVDPLFFFLLSVQRDHKCIVINWPLTTTIVAFRSVTDFIYFLNVLLQFRLAYVAPESRVVGAGELVDHPKRIALHYIGGYFFIDLFIMLPLPQIMILFILPENLGSSGANYAKNLLRIAVLVQYIPRLYRFLPVLVGQSPNGFIFETAWANFFINLLTFVLAGHVIGSCWYLFGLQRINQCLRDACHNSDVKEYCSSFIDCGHGDNLTDFDNVTRKSWIGNSNASACFTTDGYTIDYGIYKQAVNLTTEDYDVISRYVYSLFWGFQQISTLAGNQTPSYFVWEVLFTMLIIGLGLLLFAFLIGNMQNFLQALGRRRLEMSLRRRDVEQWMSHRRLPQELRRKVLEAERYNWAATRGVNEEVLLESLPEDLQRDIRGHLFKYFFRSVPKFWIFSLMDEHVLDAMCGRLRPTIYIKGSKILYPGGLVEKMVFIVRGKLESTSEDGTKTMLAEGSVCGEELLTWFLEQSSFSKDGKKIKGSGQRLPSNRTVACLTNVEAFALKASDLEEVTSLFARYLRNPRIQGAIRYESPYWRSLAASRIQVAWRYRQKRLKRIRTSSESNHSSN